MKGAPSQRSAVCRSVSESSKGELESRPECPCPERPVCRCPPLSTVNSASPPATLLRATLGFGKTSNGILGGLPLRRCRITHSGGCCRLSGSRERKDTQEASDAANAPVTGKLLEDPGCILAVEPWNVVEPRSGQVHNPNARSARESICSWQTFAPRGANFQSVGKSIPWQN